MALRDNQAWIISYPTTLEDLRAALDAAADADMASVNGVADRLKDGITDGGDITMVINTEATRGSDRSQWVMVKTDVDSASLQGWFRLLGGFLLLFWGRGSLLFGRRGGRLTGP